MVRQRAARHEGLAAVLDWTPVGRVSCVSVGVFSQLLLSQELEVAVLAGQTLVVDVVHLDVSLHLLLVNELFATHVTVEEACGVNSLDVVLDVAGLDELPLTAGHGAGDGGGAVDLLRVLPQLGGHSSPVAALVAPQTPLGVEVVDVLPQTGLDPGGVVTQLTLVLRHLDTLHTVRVFPDDVIPQSGHHLAAHVTRHLTGPLLLPHGPLSLGQDGGSQTFYVGPFQAGLQTGLQTSTEIRIILEDGLHPLRGRTVLGVGAEQNNLQV